ncbi:large ribosomal subunit protein mL52 [Drosophila nasuta]|uniref:Large ribosomal subunit protein mL52 n=1 Tax=Drosophila albomicans TaxID=7291 RepID=A0A6P8X4V9_DROAB|nr:39S ribosomal protein L52, mitochondrial [Drosophila albomicans]XP_060654432.1 large ribosomal subunit protein mL52 [Drosophila nasuta]
MLQISRFCLTTANTVTAQRHIAISASRFIDQKWRADRGLTENPNAFGPLTNLPDYTYLDGRATPLGSNQKKRLLKQQEVAAKIVELSSELEFAKARHERLKSEAKAEKQRIIQNKLKPKGQLLLKKK